jgi:hypothetical protein
MPYAKRVEPTFLWMTLRRFESANTLLPMPDPSNLQCPSWELQGLFGLAAFVLGLLVGK